MNITEMRNYIGVSRAEFSRRYNIPIRTLESWESEVRTPPEYVLQLLEESVRRTDIVEVTFMYDTLLQEGKIHPLFKDLDDQYGADQAAYKTVLNIVDRFRERYPNCEWEDEDVDYIDAIEGFATNLLMATLGKGEANMIYSTSYQKTATIITAGNGVSQTILTRSNTGVTTETNRSRNGS